MKSKEDSERLSTKIVQSPDRVRHEQEDMERQLRLLKEGLERKRHRLTEIQNQRENIRKSASDSEKGLQLLEAIQGSINKEKYVFTESDDYYIAISVSVRCILLTIFNPFMPSGVFYLFGQIHFKFKGLNANANSVDSDQMPHFTTSDLSQHCLPVSLLCQA